MTPGCAETWAASERDITVEVIADAAGFESLAAEWDDLLEAVPRPSPFLTWDFAWTWWRHFGAGNQLHLLTARAQGGQLIGLAPLHIVPRRAFGLRVRSLEFLGYRGSSVCVDHLDFLARTPNRSGITQILLRALFRSPRAWDIARLADLADDSPVRTLWPAAAGDCWAEEPGEICYYLALPGSTEALWGCLRARHPGLVSNQMRYRRSWQRVSRVEFRPTPPPTELRAAMAELGHLHGLARGRHHEAGSFGIAEYRAFHADLAARMQARNRLYLARLCRDGVTAAALYGFVIGGVLYYYQSGFDPLRSGAGKLMLGNVLEDAIQRLGLREFDFLRGDEAYKRNWSDGSRTTRTLLAWRPGVRGACHRLRWRAWRRVQLGRAWAGRAWRHLTPQA